jgi:hypothetical protein
MARRPINYSFSLSQKAGDLVDRIPNAGGGNRGKSATVSIAIEWFFESPVYEQEYTTDPPYPASSLDLDEWRSQAVPTGKLVIGEEGVRHPVQILEYLESVLKEKAQLEARLASRPPIVREPRGRLARILSRMRAWLPGR